MAKRKKLAEKVFKKTPRIELSSETKRGIFIIFILAFGVVSLLSLMNSTGVLGDYLSQVIIFLFGWGRWFFPFLFFGWGYELYQKERKGVKGAVYLGIFLFILSIQALLHFLIPSADWQKAIDIGQGGGYLGMFLAGTFDKLIGMLASLIILVCLLAVSLMLMFNKPLSHLFGKDSLIAKVLYPFNFLIAKFSTQINSKHSVGADAYDDSAQLEAEDEEEIEEEIPELDPPDNPGFSSREIVSEPAFMKPTKKEKVKEDTWKPNHVKIDLPLDLLSAKVGKPTSGDIRNNAMVIQRTLENFGIPVEMGDITVGPTVTQYTFKPAEGIKLSKITTLSNDLALSLAAHPIRIEAPIPGKSLVGVEVPNQTKAIVGLREILEAEEFTKRKNNLMIALGKDVAGKSWLYELSKMPHLLVAGQTNSGKSVCLNAVIVSLLYQNNPDDLRFIMVDPKRVELTLYNGIPHLLTPVITDVSKTINALKWCLNEMDRRFDVLSKVHKRNIQAYNESNKEKMPYIVFIIDELADLMVAASKDIEGSVIRLSQMARAVGIHLILATQRPSVDVITGLIKANMPARIAFSVASGIDSKTILDTSGAEKLLGKGDMLFVNAEESKPKRIQGAFVSDIEIKKIVNYTKERGGEPNYVENITDRQKVKGMAGHGMDGGSDDDDELLEEAKELIINSGKASTSYLQRRLSVGYSRAARLIDLLEDIGVVGPANGSKPREVMVSREQYEAMTSQGTAGVSLHNRDESEAPEEFLPDESEDDEVEEVEVKEVEKIEKEENNLEDVFTEEDAVEEKEVTTSKTKSIEDDDFDKLFSK